MVLIIFVHGEACKPYVHNVFADFSRTTAKRYEDNCYHEFWQYILALRDGSVDGLMDGWLHCWKGDGCGGRAYDVDG